MAGKKGMKIPSRSMSAGKQKRLTAQWRENIQAGVLLQRLTDHHLGKLEKPLDQTQIKAAEVVLSRLVPTLSAIEQTNHEATRSSEDIINDIRALLAAKPDLLATLLPGYEIVPTATVKHDAPQQVADTEQPRQTH